MLVIAMTLERPLTHPSVFLNPKVCDILKSSFCLPLNLTKHAFVFLSPFDFTQVLTTLALHL